MLIWNKDAANKYSSSITDILNVTLYYPINRNEVKAATIVICNSSDTIILYDSVPVNTVPAAMEIANDMVKRLLENALRVVKD